MISLKNSIKYSWKPLLTNNLPELWAVWNFENADLSVRINKSKVHGVEYRATGDIADATLFIHNNGFRTQFHGISSTYSATIGNEKAGNRFDFLLSMPPIFNLDISFTNQNANGNMNSSPTEKTDSPNVSVTVNLAPSHPLILMIPFTLPSSDVKASSPFPLSTKVPSICPSL